MEKQLFTSAHEITPLTMAIISSRDEGGKSISYILEEKIEYISNNSPSKLIDEACKFFGSSLKGRQEGTRDVCGLTHKVPVSIDPASGMYFFPTYSPTSPKCSWIAHSHVDRISRTDEGRTEILFKNGKEVNLDVSYGSILNQIRRTAQFRFLLDNRIKYIKNQLEFEPF
ncbi:competence protein ComK [Oceanobacillus sp. FSL H7-0719]|uniref:competence protein ComK n=1 Tax=Oceanobacillus sp. FSL H7-0719 TaxID=2954507 RepID=UPI003247201F